MKISYDERGTSENQKPTNKQKRLIKIAKGFYIKA
jgi:hypothetical protein